MQSIRTTTLLILTYAVSIGDCHLVPSDVIAADPYVAVLGVAQDGGFPQIGCKKDCCQRAWGDPSSRRHVASLAIVDPVSNERWLIDCTRFSRAVASLEQICPSMTGLASTGFLDSRTHGTLHRTDASRKRGVGCKVGTAYAMPRMRRFSRRMVRGISWFRCSKLWSIRWSLGRRFN